MENNNVNRDVFLKHFKSRITSEHEVFFVSCHVDTGNQIGLRFFDRKNYSADAQQRHKNVFHIFQRLPQKIIDEAKVFETDGVQTLIVACIDDADASRPHIHALVAVPKEAGGKVLALHKTNMDYAGRVRIHEIHVASVSAEAARDGKSVPEVIGTKFRYAYRYIREYLEHRAMTDETIRFFPASASPYDVKRRKRLITTIKKAARDQRRRLETIGTVGPFGGGESKQPERSEIEIGAGVLVVPPKSEV